MIQDYIISISQIVFIVALIPSIKSKLEKPNLYTSIVTSICLFLISYCFYTLSLLFSAVSSAMSGIMWAILAWQRLNLTREEKKYVSQINY